MVELKREIPGTPVALAPLADICRNGNPDIDLSSIDCADILANAKSDLDKTGKSGDAGRNMTTATPQGLSAPKEKTNTTDMRAPQTRRAADNSVLGTVRLVNGTTILGSLAVNNTNSSLPVFLASPKNQTQVRIAFIPNDTFVAAGMNKSLLHATEVPVQVHLISLTYNSAGLTVYLQMQVDAFNPSSTGPLLLTLCATMAPPATVPGSGSFSRLVLAVCPYNASILSTNQTFGFDRVSGALRPFSTPGNVTTLNAMAATNIMSIANAYLGVNAAAPPPKSPPPPPPKPLTMQFVPAILETALNATIASSSAVVSTSTTSTSTSETPTASPPPPPPPAAAAAALSPGQEDMEEKGVWVVQAASATGTSQAADSSAYPESQAADPSASPESQDSEPVLIRRRFSKDT